MNLWFTQTLRNILISVILKAKLLSSTFKVLLFLFRLMNEFIQTYITCCVRTRVVRRTFQVLFIYYLFYVYVNIHKAISSSHLYECVVHWHTRVFVDSSRVKLIHINETRFILRISRSRIARIFIKRLSLS